MSSDCLCKDPHVLVFLFDKQSNFDSISAGFCHNMFLNILQATVPIPNRLETLYHPRQKECHISVGILNASG